MDSEEQIELISQADKLLIFTKTISVLAILLIEVRKRNIIYYKPSEHKYDINQSY